MHVGMIKLYFQSAHLDAECLVDLVLDREAVTVPTEPPLHVEATLVGIASHHILNQRTQLLWSTNIHLAAKAISF